MNDLAPAASHPLANAIVALLEANGLNAGLSRVDDPTPPYVVVHVAPGRTGGDSGTLGDRYRDLWMPFQTTSVGATAEQALAMHDRVVAVLLGATPDAGGRTSHPIWFDEAPQSIGRSMNQLVTRDDTAAEPLFVAPTRWMWLTTRNT